MKTGKGKRGFSLAELLIVVAIIAVLLAIAIPNVIGYYRSLKLTELDDSARSIFVAAQNRLTALKSAGTDLTKLGGAEIAVSLPGGGTANVRAVTGGDGLAALVPGGSIEAQLHSNHYVVEIDPKTGAVFAVWYWEKEGFTYSAATYDVNDMSRDKRLKDNEMVGYYGGDKIDRLTFKQMPFPSIKLINAEELRVEITVPAMSFGTGSGYRDDNVLVDVLVDGVTIVKDANLWPDNDPGGSRVGTVVLDTLKTGGVMPDDVPYKDNFNPTTHTSNSGNSGWTYGMQYKDWETAYPDFNFPEPGEELTVAVKLHYNGTVNINGTDTNLMPQTVIVQGNSLFESVDSTTGTANIAYGRHLQNLDTVTSGVTTAITTAKQTRDINFAATAKDSADPVYYWGSTYPASDEDPDNGQDGFRDFQEINNSLTEYNGQDHEIRNMYIVAETGYGGLFSMVAGGSYHNITIVNPHVHEEPNSTSGKGASVGALIGMAGGNVEIRECKVYVDYDPEKDTQDLKEQFERVFKEKLDSMTIDTTPKGNCYVEALLGFPHIEGAEPNSSAGGLVGLFSGNISLQNSFCSIPVVGQLNAGGLVGNASTCNISISKSYSASFVYGHGTVGGLVGHAGDSYSTIKIENCYAAGEIMNGNPSSFIGAGLVNIHENANIEGIVNNYSAVKFVNATGAPKTGGGEEKQGTVYGTYNGDESGKNYYIADPAVTKGYGQQASGGSVSCGEKVTTADLLEKFKDKPGWNVDPTAGAGKTHPYRLLKELDGLPDVYPYPMLTDTAGNVLPHYGDWIGETVSPSSLCYYDVVDGNYGVWGYIVDPAHPGTLNFVNTLASGTAGSGTCATDDGYGVLVEDTGAAPTVSGVAGATIVSPPIDVTIDGKDYDLYKIEIDTSFTSTGYYTEITVDTTEYWFNPFFACEVQKPGTGNIATAEPMAKSGAAGEGSSDDYTNKVVIRTARQLANLAKQTGDKYNGGTDQQKDAQNRNYVQLLDIDYSKYTGDLAFGNATGKEQTPASLNEGSYNGNDFLIRNLYIKGSNDGAGLFGDTKGDMNNIRLVNVGVAGSKKFTGALAGRFQGDTVTDCSVYVDETNKPTGTGEAYDNFVISGKEARVGGLIGSLNSKAAATLTRCFAAVRVEGEDNYVGGLVGYIAADNDDTTLINCYSGGHTNSGEYKLDSGGKANVTGSRYVGGLIGGVSGTSHNIILSGVNYSTCSVKTTGTNHDEIGLLAGRDDNSVKVDSTTSTTSTAYATGVAFDKDGEITPRDEKFYLTPAVPVTSPTVTAHPYDTLTGPYPFASGLKDHYGDWPEATVSAQGIAYVEIENNEVHIHLVGVNSDGRIVQYNDLCVERHDDMLPEHKITNSYFATFATGGGTAPILSSGVKEFSGTDPGVGDVLKKLLGDSAVNIKLYENSDNNSYIQQGAIAIGSNGHYAHYVPRFSNVSVDKNNGDVFGKKEGSAFDIRTVEQLDNLPDSQNKYFKLSHDLYGEGYTKTFEGGSFSGKLDGCGYRILELKLTGGLFKNTTSDAVIKNLILYSPSGNANITPSTGSNAYAGGLVQEVNGRTTIENCIVAGYKLSGKQVGGLVAKSSGELTITNCAAVNNLTSNKGNGTAGGLIGNYQSGTCTIKNSYAGGSIIGQTGNENIGGLYGGACSSAPTVENCYSYVDLTGTKGTVNTLGNKASGNTFYYLENTLPTDGVTQGTGQTTEQLKSCMKDVKDSKGNLIFGTADNAHTFHPSATLTGAFPFPAIVQVDGHFVHYGDWPNP